MVRNRLNRFAAAMAIFLLIIGFSTTAKAEAEKSAEASLSIMSDYIWRGFNLGDNGVMQPSVSLGYGGFGANIWANYDLDQNDLNETDITLSYAFDAGENLGLEIGHVYYALEGTDTQELYLAAAASGPLSPTLAVYWDFDEGDGAFLEASVGRSVPFNEISVDLGASLSYNLSSKFSIGDYDGFHNAVLSAALAIPLQDDITIEPMVAYSFALSDDAENAIESLSGDDDFFYGGVTASLAF